MRFEIRRSAIGQFYWVIVGGNGEVMAQPETVLAKAPCAAAIAVGPASAANARVDDRT
jgi:uncharacterized protein YegP (UPF0339 family)